MLARLAVLLVLLVFCGSVSPAGAAGGRLFTISDPRIDEASGLAVARRTPGVLFLQNDSGDRARFFAVSAGTGRTVAVCTVPDAVNVDWEDLATGPDSRGVPSVWLADIGDNDEVRAQVQVYRVDEPLLTEAAVTTGRPEVWRLRYPDGAHNAETLLADPIRHRLYIVTKSLLGRSEVFQVPAGSAGGRLQTMTRVGSVTFGLTGTPGGPNLIGQLTATGGSVSSDGRLLVIRTYTDAYLWPVADGDVAAALRAAPTRLALPAQPQGEGVALANGALLIDSEGTPSAVYRVPLPVTPTSATPTPRPKVTATVPAPPVAAPAAAGEQTRRPYLIGGAVLLAAALILLGRRVRRRGGR